ncbi:hypothetical protein EMIT0P395_100012 [Pseudomonas sp. IT-P395]
MSKRTVGAAEGCDLLIWMLKTRSKDRSLRQLLQGRRQKLKGLCRRPSLITEGGRS